MKNRPCGPVVILALFLPIWIFLQCGKNLNNEVSTQANVISCRYIDVGEQGGHPVVNLVFTNQTGRPVQTVFGGLRIVNREGVILQKTGFTYSRPFAAGAEIRIPAFAYIDLKPEAMNLLSTPIDFNPVVFELTDVIFEDGQSLNFE